ncbi:MAG TPA: hypothetical protein VIN39_05485 [Candidatus Dormibacteraeota bacterium]|jgi:hypothetical protein
MPDKAGPSDEVGPPELSDLAARIEGLSSRLEIVAFRKPGWQKQSTTPIFMAGYSIEVRDRENPETLIITTAKLFAAGVSDLDQTQRRYIGSIRRRYVALLLFLLAIIALPLTTDARIVWIAWPAVVIFVGAGVWLWIRSRRTRPSGWPGIRESMGMMLGVRRKPRS